jgi:hypothetical protein
MENLVRFSGDDLVSMGRNFIFRRGMRKGRY